MLTLLSDILRIRSSKFLSLLKYASNPKSVLSSFLCSSLPSSPQNGDKDQITGYDVQFFIKSRHCKKSPQNFVVELSSSRRSFGKQMASEQDDRFNFLLRCGRLGQSYGNQD